MQYLGLPFSYSLCLYSVSIVGGFFKILFLQKILSFLYVLDFEKFYKILSMN